MNARIYILFICSMLAVSTSPIIARYLYHIDPISISFWRMFIGGMILVIYGFFSRIESISNGNKYKTYIAGLLLGVHFALFYGAISLLPNNITNATVFGTLAPLFILILEFYFGRKIRFRLVMGLLIVLFGSLIMFIYDFSLSSNLTQGNILSILCSVCFAVIFILSEKVREKDSAISFSRSIFLYASLTLLFIAIMFKVPLFSITFHDFMFLLFLGIVPTLIGHSVFYYLTKHLSPVIVSSIPLGEPFIASIFAWYLFPGQILNFSIITGGIITLFGLYIIIQNKKT